MKKYTINLQVEHSVGDKVYVIEKTQCKKECEICNQTGQVEINNSPFTCPNCYGKGVVYGNLAYKVLEGQYEIQQSVITIGREPKIERIKHKLINSEGRKINRVEDKIFNTLEEAERACVLLNRGKAIINLEDIVIPDAFLNAQPGDGKIGKKIKYYMENKKFDKKIIVNNKYELIDGYITYLLCQTLKINQVEVEIEG